MTNAEQWGRRESLIWPPRGYLYTLAEASCGKGVVKELADWLLTQTPDLKGFSASNLWRMKQFYEVYRDDAKLAPLVRVLAWTPGQDRIRLKFARGQVLDLFFPRAIAASNSNE